MRFNLDWEGRAREIGVRGEGPGDEELGACLVLGLESLDLPALASRMTFEQTYVFASDAEASDEEMRLDGVLVEPSETEELFQVEFLANIPHVTALELKCHQGELQGVPPLTIEVGKGPCRVQLQKASGAKLVTWVGLTGPAAYSCSESGGEGQEPKLACRKL